jgi:hypothetical protein
VLFQRNKYRNRNLRSPALPLTTGSKERGGPRAFLRTGRVRMNFLVQNSQSMENFAHEEKYALKL